MFSTFRFVGGPPVTRFETRLDSEARKGQVAGQASPAPSGGSSDPPAQFAESSGSRRMFATKIASRLVLEGTGFGRYDSGDLLPESPIIHTIVRPRASGWSFGTRLCSQKEPWIQSPPDRKIRGRLQA